ncbi:MULTISPECIES: fatty acid desaturase family protein [Prauserella salsuginis group]|uniref:Fatty acid desaturase family protein n=1 Tax=Prauserella salsuginis TaxID=387889 RepID=A0ABW6G1U4_9PSEU|nr:MULTISPECIES: acyl-CoA desaturase [Prauserella salsuginis group]MCR3721633.1 Fatty acid desaturase [Prauserella flava]MCR3734325.1 Fatty acid desaturase [Prauserella salsuginis]
MTGLQDRLTPEQVEEFGREMDELRRRVVADLGAEDVEYIQNVIKTQRGLEVTGRALMYAGFFPPAWLAGVGALSLAKILDNMEIGHNVMHGQYDWTRDPALSSQRFEWDNVAPAENWRHSHNYIHHTYTNIVDKDRDVGYGILRIDPAQKWHPYYLGNPVYATLLAIFFQWGVMLHDLEVDRVLKGERKWSEFSEERRRIGRKMGRQIGKDYVLFPLLTGPLAPLTFAGNAAANLARNLWAFGIIFCGHFPADVESFSEEETERETRGQWYLRQILGSANITGGSLFHILSGNLSHQIEHHLFPDIPARRYPQIAGEVRAICEKYGLPYHTGPLHKQLWSVAKKIVKFALPGSGDREPEPATVERDRTPAAA